MLALMNMTLVIFFAVFGTDEHNFCCSLYGIENSMPSYIIRRMTHRDFEVAIAWAAAEGWNPGLNDAHCFYAADPDGFLMGFLGEEPVSCISAVKYGDSFGFIGFYIVKPEFRGQGYGWQIWQAALASLQGRTVGLDGVVAQQDNYLKSGFQLAYRNVRYEGIRREEAISDALSSDVSSRLISPENYPIDDVIEYDRPFFTGNRDRFLRCWLTQSESYAIGMLEQQAIVGYGVLRPCQQGCKIGPLFADTPDIAEEIFQALKAKVPVNQHFYLDLPLVNTAAVELAHRHRMVNIFETARMYTPRIPELPTHRIFGVTTFELG